MKRRILFIHNNLGGGGAEGALIEVLNHLDYNRYDVTLFLLYRTGDFIDRVPPQVHFKHEQFGRFFPGYKGKIAIRCGLRNMLLRCCAKRVFANEKYDTIVSFMESAPAKFHSYILDKGKRNITWVHCDLLNNHYTTGFFLTLKQEQKFYSRMDDVIFVSEDAKKNFSKLFGIDKGRVIYNIIDQRAICKRSKAVSSMPRHRTFTFVNVGSLKEIKRQDRIIETAALLKARGYDADFWLIGKGIWEERLKAQATALNVSDSVYFLGFQSNPYPYVAAADVFLMTSDSEGFPLVVAEAMCLGKAVISTRITGPMEMLGNGRYGILTGFSPEEIANSAISLIEDPKLLSSYQHLAYERSISYFDVNGVMTQIHDVIGN